MTGEAHFSCTWRVACRRAWFDFQALLQSATLSCGNSSMISMVFRRASGGLSRSHAKFANVFKRVKESICFSQLLHVRDTTTTPYTGQRRRQRPARRHARRAARPFRPRSPACPRNPLGAFDYFAESVEMTLSCTPCNSLKSFQVSKPPLSCIRHALLQVSYDA